MNPTQTPAVLTSRPAREEYQDILGQHADLIRGMTEQNTKRMNALQVSQEKEAQTTKDLALNSLKQEELSIKRAALNS